MELYDIERFDLDCTYSKGVFWKTLPQPIHKTDLYPQSDKVVKADSGDLPFEDNSMSSVMFDPPFIIEGKNTYHKTKAGSSIIAKRFEGYFNFEELKAHYFRTLKESYRLLKNDGLLVMKCQDIVSSGKNHFTHCMVMQMAIDIGYCPQDMFVLISKNRINSFGTKWQRQYHARKYHSYFWVLKKTTNKINYQLQNN